MKLKIGDTEYLLDEEKALASGVLIAASTIPKLGDRVVKVGNSSTEYIVAAVCDGNCVLINLKSGNCWSRPVKVQDYYNITLQEWKQLQGSGEFVKIQAK